MSSPLRIQFPGALLHITSRGDHQQFIFRDAEDFEYRQHLIGVTATERNWGMHSFTIMGNHDHLCFDLATENVSSGVQTMNGTYAQYFNKKYGGSGHVFEDRFGSVVVDGESHFLSISAYLPLNPVRARIVTDPADYPWSSYRSTAGLVIPPPWLNVQSTLSRFAGPDPHLAFREFVISRIAKPSPFEEAHQNVLGSEAFRSRVQALIDPSSVPKSVSRRAREIVTRPSFNEILSAACDVLEIDPTYVFARNAREVRGFIGVAAREEGALDLRSIAKRFNRSIAETSRSISRARIAFRESSIMRAQYRAILDRLYSSGRIRLPPHTSAST